jgi:catalase
MSFGGNRGLAVNYGPNSFDGPAAEPRYLEPPLHLTGDGDRYNHRAGNDDYTQTGNLFRLMDAGARSRLVGNLVAALAGVPKRIQLRQLAHFYRADPEYGCAVAVGLDIQLIEIERLARLSLPELPKATAL